MTRVAFDDIERRLASERAASSSDPDPDAPAPAPAGFHPALPRAARAEAFAALERALADDPNDPRPHLVVADDNFYYAGMRYQCHRLARRAAAAHVQLYLPVDLDLAHARNAARHPSEVARMATPSTAWPTPSSFPTATVAPSSETPPSSFHRAPKPTTRTRAPCGIGYGPPGGRARLSPSLWRRRRRGARRIGGEREERGARVGHPQPQGARFGDGICSRVGDGRRGAGEIERAAQRGEAGDVGGCARGGRGAWRETETTVKGEGMDDAEADFAFAAVAMAREAEFAEACRVAAKGE